MDRKFRAAEDPYNQAPSNTEEMIFNFVDVKTKIQESRMELIRPHGH